MEPVNHTYAKIENRYYPVEGSLRNTLRTYEKLKKSERDAAEKTIGLVLAGTVFSCFHPIPTFSLGTYLCGILCCMGDEVERWEKRSGDLAINCKELIETVGILPIEADQIDLTAGHEIIHLKFSAERNIQTALLYD